MLSAVGLPVLGALAPVVGASDPVLLSEDQREWADSNPVVRYGISSVSYPFVFEDGGRPKGIVIDYLSRVEARTGLAFRHVPMAGKVEARRALAAGEIALVPFMRIDEARKATYAFTKPVARVALGLFTRTDGPYVEALDDLAGRRVGVPAGAAEAFGRVRSAPAYVEFDSTSALVRALGEGRVDAIVAPAPNVRFEVGRQHAQARVVLQTILSTKVPYGMACGLGTSPLVGILDRALDRMLRQERLDIAARYAQAPSGSGVVPTAAQAAIVTTAMAAAVAAASVLRNGRVTGR
jgi:ABC-type amino acid transport substrate-binding protein